MGYLRIFWIVREELFGNVLRYELFKLFREYVADTAKGKRKQRILNASMDYVESCGILNRLYYSFERERVEYCCGQEWHSEMAVLRDCFDRR